MKDVWGFKFIDGLALGAILLVAIGLKTFPEKNQRAEEFKESIATLEKLQNQAQIKPLEKAIEDALPGEVESVEEDQITVALPVKVEVVMKKPKEILKVPRPRLSEVDRYLISEQAQDLFDGPEDGRSLSAEERPLGENPTELEIESHDFAKREFQTEW